MQSEQDPVLTAAGLANQGSKGDERSRSSKISRPYVRPTLSDSPAAVGGHDYAPAETRKRV